MPRTLTSSSSLRRLLVFVIITPFILPLLFIISIVLRLVAILIAKLCGNYGKFISFGDGALDEDFIVTKSPRATVVTTLELDGDLGVEQVRKLFSDKVLKATIADGIWLRKRYPEFQQYLTTLLGFRIWRDDPNFRIENHVREETCGEVNGNTKEIGEASLDLSELHQRLINLRYEDLRSPWELLVLRNVFVPGDGQGSKTVLALRLHHVMGDAKSILKVLVECLGSKPLTTAESRSQPSSSLSKSLLFPFHFTREVFNLLGSGLRSFSHPFMSSVKDNSEFALQFTEPIDMAHIKRVVKACQVTTSAVLISTISGALRRLDKPELCSDIAMGYVLPKSGHPPTLGNHCRICVDTLPTSEASTMVRLHRSELVFQSLKKPERGISTESVARIFGSFPAFFSNYLTVNVYAPTGITNIAGEREGFDIGGRPCTGFRMSVGCLPGCAGIVFCAFSYKQTIRIAVMGKESVLGRDETKRLAHLIDLEFRELLLPHLE